MKAFERKNIIQFYPGISYISLYIILFLGADSLKQFAKDIGKEDALHIVRLDVTKDASVNDAKVRCDTYGNKTFFNII